MWPVSSGAAGLYSQTPAAGQPKANGDQQPAPKNAKTAPKVLSPEQAIKQSQAIERAIKKSEEKITVKFKVTAVQTLRVSNSNVIFDANAGYHEVFILREGDRFVVQILPPAMDTIRRLGISDEHFKGKVVQVTGRLQPGQPALGTGQFQIAVTDLTQFEIVGK